MSKYIFYELKEKTAYITLDDPATKNSLHFTVLKDIQEFFQTAESDPRVRCVVLKGTGGVFSSGGNINSMNDPSQRIIDGEVLEGEKIIKLFSDTVWKIRQCLKPTVACLEGVVAGAAISLALACDFRYAADGCKMVFAFPQVGLMADSGILALLKNIAGYPAATELALFGGKIGTQKAISLGLINEAVPREEYDSFVESKIKQLSNGPTLAYRASKICLNALLEKDFEICTDLEKKLIPLLRNSNDHKEAVNSFIEKRQPVFTNS